MTEIKPSSFEESMKYTQRSVGYVDVRKYQAFTKTLQQSRGLGTKFRFAETSTRATGFYPLFLLPIWLMKMTYTVRLFMYFYELWFSLYTSMLGVWVICDLVT